MTEEIDIADPIRTRGILERYGLNAKKSLGQNFLTRPQILKDIVSAAEISEADDVIEVGPGIGALTEQLARHAHHVLAFEIDDNLLNVLDETLAPYQNITIINGDILQVDLPKVVSEELDGKHTLKVVANLPYYITTPILKGLLQSPLTLDQIVVMMQKEVADRLNAVPGTKAYGSLSVAVQLEMNVNVEFEVPKTAFVPQPKVDSAIVKLTHREPREVQPYSKDAFFKTVHGCFAHRRKTLWNNLVGIYGKDDETKAKLEAVLAKLEIKPGVRPERLTVDDFVRLTNELK
ncbi:16S rRNA (adenine(1518)-N(6)/adenine(1519)-N(6))-dimethyltransferase RsmA [Pediococcus inopinatus]|jgi:16S rRNA (adenine1518-N6/adenine1519-N6)-dimethyltransferase|uniref:Ribosomal RNA small subunit methyltransferase A n=1 Tax=Pediococcus inopinatus TaxID=114090 RepID=A0ABZ0Q4S9_9LACO|nr:16S rRNA (adenine(1518)-N(6)/adenine(1519)-N(6))-dimethyltransferase RsmA [Pediococcus inopinatus]AVK99211.1 16S rRNA (adenine(1518)-N(6)/adenine(1519)-N(6))-dimethyltransferase [Pediococcus inopinatus]KRN61482.1 ksgA protein [Pediococcus inopinatus]WPC20248.1 16S rRNA (adenine(1518)-N(6)/adenine(1519)-N(6))-dimethyltransferase RsmA [Pediococcus inopinatus]WPC21954.1 16S rRNA (adenine(1518)-N(6)/adenine(1519)-N(6))-dimethyltransferase RsmA [Pediococcus inopinatus]WPP09116.1 16S rRNA (adenin